MLKIICGEIIELTSIENQFVFELQNLINQPLKISIKLQRIEEWFRDNKEPVLLYFDPNQEKKLEYDEVISLLRDGIETWAGFNKKTREKAHQFQFTQMFNSNEQLRDLDDKFAVVTTLRKFYGMPKYKLTLGTIIKDNEEYWVCVQPRCDTYRITTQRSFPFLPLQVVENNKKFDLVIKDNNQYIRVKILNKPYYIRLISFQPNEKQIVSATNGIYTDVQDNKFIWIGELRFEQAQKLSNKLATELSRVGVNESQWLRRWSTKG